MKKYLITLAAVAMCATAFAKDPIKLVSGDLSALAGKTVYVQMDTTGTIIVDEDSKKEMTLRQFCQMKGDDWVRDMGKDDADAIGEVSDKLASGVNKFDITVNKEKADIILTVKPTKFSYGNPFAMTAFMSNDINGFFYGRFIFTTKDGTPVAELVSDKINQSDNGYTWTQEKCLVYRKVGKVLASFLNSKVK